jgi:NADH-quinone oxidoreductase subunit J
MLDFLFYSFAFLMVFAALMVIILRNPVHAVLFLIFTFFNAAAIFLLLGAEFIAMILIIVYVGAVAILFLFVVMMLNINLATMRQGFLKLLPLGIIFSGLFIYQIYVMLSHNTAPARQLNDIPLGQTNTKSLGMVLYTDYLLVFQIAGIILLVAMIGAIILTITPSQNVRKQSIYKQVTRTRRESVEVVKAEFGKGVKL